MAWQVSFWRGGWRARPRDLARSDLARQLGLAAAGVGVGGVLGVLVVAVNPLYVAAGLVGLLAGAAMLASAQVGFLALVGVATLLPFAVIPVPLGTVKLTALDVTLTILLLVWLARLLLSRDEALRLSGLEAPVALFVGLAVFSFLAGTGTSGETTRLFLKMINSVLLFFTTVNSVRTRRQVERVVLALIVGGAASAALGVALYVIPRPTAARLLSALAPLGYPAGGGVLRYIASTDVLRAISTSIDPNIFGAMLMLAAALAISQAVAPRPLLDRRLLLALGAVIGLALLLSYSRSSWMGTLAAGLLVVTLRYRRPWLVALLAGLLAGVLLLPSAGGYLGHLQSGFAARDQAAAMRLGEYKDALRLITQYPFFGVGFGAAPDVDLYVGVSSIYLLLAEQMGLVGLTSYLLVVGLLLWRGLGLLLRGGLDPAAEPLLLGTTAALVAALTAGVFDHHFVNLRFPHILALFWLLAGLVVVSAELARPEVPASG